MEKIERFQQMRESVRMLFNDELSLCVFDARVNIGEKKTLFPKIFNFTVLDEATKARLLCFNEEVFNSRREKFLYGAGMGCKYVVEGEFGIVYHGVEWLGIIDNNVTGARYGLPIISFKEFVEKHKTALVFNSVGLPAGLSIHKQCTEAGIDCTSLFEFDKSWDQYFDLPSEFGLVEDGEVFVQAGCYNGDTQKSYINWFGDSYSKMVTFEPSVAHISICKEKLQGLRDIEIVQAGLSDHSGTVRFDLREPGASFISESGGEEIPVVSLDEYMKGQRVTFIALDIEGSELAALRGAEQIIRKQKPKLAISVYHKPEDIYELPLLIKKYNPEYRLYLRHYHLMDSYETVLYAL